LKVFITGATGLIGSHIVQELINKKYELTAIRRDTSSMTLLGPDATSKVRWLTGDILDTELLYEAIKEVDCVIHCAGVISEANINLMYRVNIEGTANIVNCCLEAGVKKLIHFGSIAALGKNKNGELISEATQWEDGPQNSEYGISKMLGEREVWRGIAEGLSAIILSPSVVLGMGNGKTGSSIILSLIARGYKKYPVGGTAFVDVRDVAKLTVNALESENVSENYIVSGHNRSFRDLMTDFGTALDITPPTSAMKKSFLNLIACADSIISFITRRPRQITTMTIRQLMRTLQYDNSKSKMAFNYDYTAWETTVSRLSEAYKEK
jgi:nucleoside-diphosphate-sugar epimerase